MLASASSHKWTWFLQFHLFRWNVMAAQFFYSRITLVRISKSKVQISITTKSHLSEITSFWIMLASASSLHFHQSTSWNGQSSLATYGNETKLGQNWRTSGTPNFFLELWCNFVSLRTGHFSLWIDENVMMMQKPTWSLYNIATSSITMQATIINRKLLYKWLCWTILTMLPINIM
jgi:hypothetical protein